MKLLVQPDDGAAPILAAIDEAESSIEVYIFRLAYPKLKRALANAVLRGVSVRALIAHLNASGEEPLRKLESDLLEIGVTVSRTDKDLLRYHGKLMIVDRSTLYVLGYNFTRRDIEQSRSLGLAIHQPSLVDEAIRLFEADFDRQLYTPRLDELVISPFNSRSSLLGLIEGAKKRLLIYDPRLTDNLMQHAIEQRAVAGVEVRVIGNVEKKLQNVQVGAYQGQRMHVRAIIQDGRKVFIGSQGLRRAELDRRREIGVIIDHRDVVRGVTEIFEQDWAETPQARRARKKKAAKK